MTPDAKLRMEVYQEGQRAFTSKAPCLYTDWRRDTWYRGFTAAMTYHAAQVAADEAPVFPPPTEMKSAGWTIRRAGTRIEIESRDGSGTGISRDLGDVFHYFNDLLKENNL